MTFPHHQRAVYYSYPVIKIYLGSFYSYMIILIQKPFNRINFFITYNRRPVEPIHEIHNSVRLLYTDMFLFGNIYKDIGAEKRLQYHLLPVRPLFLYFVQRAIDFYFLFFQKISHFLFPSWTGVEVIPVFLCNRNHELIFVSAKIHIPLDRMIGFS